MSDGQILVVQQTYPIFIISPYKTTFVISHKKTHTNEKKILSLQLCWLLFSEIWSTSDLRFFQVISVVKREPLGTFLSLDLFISQPQKCGLSFKKLSLGSLFSTSITWTNLKSDVDKFFLRVASTIIKTKYYYQEEIIFL